MAPASSRSSRVGASSGIGAETCRVLALRGVRVVMGVRTPSAGERVKEEIVKNVPAADSPHSQILRKAGQKKAEPNRHVSSMSSVKRFADNFNGLNLPLNILINNAGIAFSPFTLSDDGIELQFATNYLGHFLLTNLLLEKMKITAMESGIEGRVVIVASDSYKHTYREGIRFDKLNDASGYKGILAYGQSKLANILRSNELSCRLKEEDAKVVVNSLHPGVVATNITRHLGIIKDILSPIAKLVLRGVEQGAATVCYLALHPQVAGVTGKYFVDFNAVELKPPATDKELSKKLWDFSVSLLQ
ncbi:short-chain dehydrogenase TIC 32, chloroplastic isoform X2 [Zea mays]|uniref:short-chain dehydrogenase TIC 32, chloroplastic isoform X2 n=1 Tax=Zea mays TaxID=4577 RepID=UPI0004DEBBDC|nr:short-chain dehydrogenase TIC 32, chloroplastic isoform X2 [Zea mays]|eukprot:XP_008663103.1 short-chain dehydrogenase TIC 32, chloroplastic isoform X2 [Zea mays]